MERLSEVSRVINPTQAHPEELLSEHLVSHRVLKNILNAFSSSEMLCLSWPPFPLTFLDALEVRNEIFFFPLFSPYIPTVHEKEFGNNIC